MKTLTPKQLEILQFIQTFVAQHHYSPSYREMMLHFKFTSPASVYKHVQTLKRKGVLSGDKRSPRSLKPTQPEKLPLEKSERDLPLIGNLSIGYPLELFMEPQMIAIPPSLVHIPENTYLLQVHGDALQDEWIRDGDLLLIEAREDVHPGEVILGLINQTDSILKRYYPEGQYIRLEGQQPNAPSLIVRSEHILIQGALVGLLRTY